MVYICQQVFELSVAQHVTVCVCFRAISSSTCDGVCVCHCVCMYVCVSVCVCVCSCLELSVTTLDASYIFHLILARAS